MEVSAEEDDVQQSAIVVNELYGHTHYLSLIIQPKILQAVSTPL